jgi:hypothetical protein
MSDIFTGTAVPPDRVYSTVLGQTVQLDGAGFLNPVFVPEITDEDSVLAFSTGTVNSAYVDFGTGGTAAIPPVLDPAGSSVGYVEVDGIGRQVQVEFSNLAVGIPHFAVARETEDSGFGRLTPGSLTGAFKGTTTRIVVIGSVASAGQLEMTVVAAGYLKKVIVTSEGVDFDYNLSATDSRIVVPVSQGDRVSVAIRTNKPNKARLINPVPVRVSWKPVASRFRLYDTAVLSYNGTTAVNALGFCGLSDRSGYAFFGTLPATLITSYPNPDTFVTVQGEGSDEYRLITCTAQGDVLTTPEPAFTDYAQQGLSGPLTFRFYSGQYSQGGHGEMDVWIDATGTFPAYFKVHDYMALALSGTGSRYVSEIGDTSRNALSVISGSDSGTLTVPAIFSSVNGYQFVIGGFSQIPPSILVNGTICDKTGTAAGLAYRISVNADPLAGDAYWQTEDLGLWLTEDGQLIDLE